MRQTILLIDDERHAADALGNALERAGRTVVICPDVESGELALQEFAVTDVVSEVHLSGRLLDFEGLHFVDRIHAEVPGARIVMMSGYASDALRAAASSYGVTAVLAKPIATSDLEAYLDGAGLDDSPFELIRVPSIDEILSGGRVQTAFQPIVATNGSEDAPFAFEALARVSGGWPLGSVMTLFQYALRRGRATELNRAAIVSSIEAAAALPQQSLVFINVDPPTFSDSHLAAEVIDTAARSGLSLERVVLEITERSSLIQDQVCVDTFATLHAAGVRFALDDHASAYSHMGTIAMSRPSFFKISGAFGTGFETDQNKQRIVRNVFALARDFGCSTVIEGIETEATAAAAGRLGIELAQGYFFSKPRDAAHWSGIAA